MSGAPTSDQIKYGLLRTRDLVELYYQGRMVVRVVCTNYSLPSGSVVKILQQNMTRIRYELIFENIVAASVSLVDIGSIPEISAGNSQEFVLTNQANFMLTRDFRSDMEGVCLELNATAGTQSGAPNVFVGVRETFLTPLPMDELP